MHTEATLLRKPILGGRNQDSKDTWVERCRAIPSAVLEAWVEDGHQSDSWRHYPWELEAEEDIYTPLNDD